MQIAVYSHYFTPEIGAPSARIFDLSRQWLRAGSGVQVVTCHPNHPTGVIYPGYRGGRYMHESISGIDVHRHWTYITRNTGLVKKTLGHLSYVAGAMLFSTRRARKPDVVVGTSPTLFAAEAAARAAARWGVPFIMEVRDLWPAVFVELGVLKNRRIIGILERWEMSLYRRAAAVVTVTEAFRADLISRGIPGSRVFTIPNGADVDFWQPSGDRDERRRELGLENRFVVLYVGAHGISQRLAAVVRAAELLREQKDVLFVLVGEGAEKPELVAMARDLGLENVRFSDPVGKDEVRRYYEASDVCLVPLRDIAIFDSFIPSKMFEMMAMERPIVASLRGEAASILNASGGAVVVAPEDSRALANAILSLRGDPARAAELGRNGRAFVKANYSRESLAHKYLDVMREAGA
jgi:glycosyltransferase involved in cell wall biosynthesis